MQYQIKKLGGGDLSLAQELLILFKKVFDEIDISRKDLPDETYLNDLLQKDGFHVFAALTDGKIVGGLTAYEFDMYMKKEKEAYIYDLAIHKNYRRQGIARSLIKALQEYAGERNISILFVEAHVEDAGAVAFYKAVGAEMEEVRHFNLPGSSAY